MSKLNKTGLELYHSLVINPIRKVLSRLVSSSTDITETDIDSILQGSEVEDDNTGYEDVQDFLTSVGGTGGDEIWETIIDEFTPEVGTTVFLFPFDNDYKEIVILHSSPNRTTNQTIVINNLLGTNLPQCNSFVNNYMTSTRKGLTIDIKHKPERVYATIIKYEKSPDASANAQSSDIVQLLVPKHNTNGQEIYGESIKGIHFKLNNGTIDGDTIKIIGVRK